MTPKIWHVFRTQVSEVGRQRKNLLFPRHRCWRLADNRKINHEKRMFRAAAWTFSFFNYYGTIGIKNRGHFEVIGTRFGSSKSAFKVKTRSLRSEIGIETRLLGSNWGHRGHRLGSIWDHWDRIEVIGVRKLDPSGQRLQKSSFFFVRENESKKFL